MTNNNSIEEAAVKTFCMAPEVYQRIFIEAGEDFPDQLVEQIKQDTKINNGMETMRLLEQDPDLKKAIVTTFTKNKEYILSAVKKLQDSTSMFKEGGKLNYLVKKFQTGGVVETEYVADIKPKGIKGWFFKETKYPRLDGNPGYFSEYITPSGDTITNVAGRWERWKRVARKNKQPEYLLSIGNDPTYRPTYDKSQIDMLNNVHGRFTYPVLSNQEGGTIISGPDSELSSVRTMLVGPSVGQKFRGVKRPWISRTVRYLSSGNDTTFTSKGIEHFIPEYTDDITKIKYNVLPNQVKEKLNKIIDTDYSDYNTTNGSWPYNIYEKTIDTEYRKKK